MQTPDSPSTGRGEQIADQTETNVAEDAAAASAVVGDRWRLEKLVGRGGQAEVWRARDRLLGQSVALKVFHAELTPAQRERLRREVMLGRELRHPHLVRVLEPAEVGGRLAVVMEWLPGGDLQREVDCGPLEVERVIEVAGAVLEALAFLHSRRVVHRDVKPSNLLLDAAGTVRLADLGLARSLEGGDTVTRTATAIGTPAYMSPEQLRGDEPSPASDLYSLGVTLWMLLAGRHPFTATSEFDLADAHLNRRPPDVTRVRPDCPRWLARFVSRLIEKRPRDRWPDATEALRAFGRRRGLVSPRRWRRTAVAAILAIAIAGAVVSVVVHRAGTPLQVRVEGMELVAATAAGREVWRVELDGRIVDLGEADVAGDGDDEVVAVVRTGEAPGFADWVVVVDRGGRETSRWPSAPGGRWPTHYGVTPEHRLRRWTVADLDGDGREELAWIGYHPRWRPSVMVGAGRAFGGRALPLLDNPGHLIDLTPCDVDGDGDDELVAVAYNNALGFLVAVALVDVRESVARSRVLIAQAPDPAPGRLPLPPPELDPLRFYTPVWENLNGGARVEVVRDRLEVVAGDGRRVALDLAGNPVASPLVGSDGRARRAMWRACDSLSRDLSVDASGGLTRVRQLVAAHGEVLVEAPMRAGAVVLLATALAQGGSAEDGAALLDEALRSQPESTVMASRRARLAWLSGRCDEAYQQWAEVLSRPGLASPELYDTLADGLRASAFAGRQDRAFQLFEIAERRLVKWEKGVRLDVASLGAFFSGQWNHPALDGDGGVGQLPELGAVRGWARLERGADPRAVEQQAAELERADLAPHAARLLRARALLWLGQPERALGFAESTLADLGPSSRVEIQSAILVPVAEWLVSRCHEALGDHERAAEHLARARALAPNTTFGRPAP